jgi:hypothetical protein
MAKKKTSVKYDKEIDKLASTLSTELIKTVHDENTKKIDEIIESNPVKKKKRKSNKDIINEDINII